MACAGHIFAAYVRADPGLVWAALTDPGQTAAYLYGLEAHSNWVPGDPIQFRLGGRAAAIGRVLHARRQERLSYLLQAGPGDPPVYLTWLLRPARGGCTVRLEIDQVDHADSSQDAEDVWLPSWPAATLGESGLTTAARTASRPARLLQRVITIWRVSRVGAAGTGHGE